MLHLSFGQASLVGQRERNEDCAAFAAPAADEVRRKGIIAALADGVGGGLHGGEAANAVVRGLIQDYYATPDTWEPGRAMQQILVALNRWLYGQSVSRHMPGGYASTLTALVFRGQRYCLAHVGDSRAYRLRAGELQCLTTDHVWTQPGMEHVLRRGMGLDDHIVLDVSGGKLEPGDLFILMSDGVWSAMTPAALHLLCSSQPDPSLLAQELVATAIRKGGQDNATALVARLEHLPKETLADEFTEAQLLPLPEKLKVGQRLDEFEVEEILHDSRETLLYRARQKPSGRQYVLKTLRPIMAGDTQAKSRLMAEEWLGKRLQSPYFSQVLPLPNRNYLYYAQDWHAGRTLAQALEAGEHFSVTETITLGIRLAKGLSALHRLDIVHRDIKPDNLHLASDNKLRILDLGVALCPTLAITAPEETPGTPSYMAPELFSGGAAGWPTDLYAAGVTLYQVLTRKYPYGEVEPFQHPH